MLHGITNVQVTNLSAGQGVISQSVSLSTSPTSGNTLVVYIWVKNSAGFATFPFGSVVDNQGNTYTQAAFGGDGIHLSAAIFYLSNVPASSGTFTITVTPNATPPNDYITMGAIEYTGLSNINPVDQVSSSAAHTATPTTGLTPTTTQANELVVAETMTTGGPNESFVPSAGYTPEMTLPGDVNHFPGQVVDQVVNLEGTYSVTWNEGIIGNAVSLIVTFKSK